MFTRPYFSSVLGYTPPETDYETEAVCSSFIGNYLIMNSYEGAREGLGSKRI